MKFKPGLILAALAAVSWGAVITADTLNLHVHILWCALVIAGITTVLAFQWLMVGDLREAIDRNNESIDSMADAYTELARAVAELMTDPRKPDAGPALRPVGARR